VRRATGQLPRPWYLTAASDGSVMTIIAPESSCPPSSKKGGDRYEAQGSFCRSPAGRVDAGRDLGEERHGVHAAAHVLHGVRRSGRAGVPGGGRILVMEGLRESMTRVREMAGLSSLSAGVFNEPSSDRGNSQLYSRERRTP